VTTLSAPFFSQFVRAGGCALCDLVFNCRVRWRFLWGICIHGEIPRRQTCASRLSRSNYLRLVQPRGYRAMPRRLANRELLRTFSRLPDAFPSLQTRSTRPLKRTHVGKLVHLITLAAVLDRLQSHRHRLNGHPSLPLFNECGGPFSARQPFQLRRGHPINSCSLFEL
jgi:hypothetical protein